MEPAQARGAKIVRLHVRHAQRDSSTQGKLKRMPLRQIAIGCAGVTHERLARLPADNSTQVEMAEPPSKSTNHFIGSFRRVASQIVARRRDFGRHKRANADGLDS